MFSLFALSLMSLIAHHSAHASEPAAHSLSVEGFQCSVSASPTPNSPPTIHCPTGHSHAHAHPSGTKQSGKYFYSFVKYDDNKFAVHRLGSIKDHRLVAMHTAATAAINQTSSLHESNVIKRFHSSNLDDFIEENKALVRRMFGESSPLPFADHEQHHHHHGGLRDSHDLHVTYTYSGSSRGQRSAGDDGTALSQMVRRVKRSREALTAALYKDRRDVCDTETEIVTPYWASNSGGKIRAIVNTQHLQQAIQQEVCQSSTSGRCGGSGCGCVQRYKWHRLLAYDPDEDCKGIFMDWFLFPASCACRCDVIDQIAFRGTSDGNVLIYH